MSGIVGLFNLDGRPAAQQDLETLAAGGGQLEPGQTRFWTSSSMGLGYRGGWAALDEQPFVASSGVAVSIDGRVDGRDDLEPSPTMPSALRSDAAYVSAIHEQAGEDFAARLNGDFAIALLDPSRGQVLLARDVMGARRLHYTQVGRTLLFASEIKSLLAYPGTVRAPDDDALADLVLDRWIDPHLTCFRGIYSVPPGQLLVGTPDTLALRPHWAFDPMRQIRFRTFDEYAECFRSIFERAVRRRMRGDRPVAVTVSGGVDSSSIFCQAASLSRRDPGLPGVHGIGMTFPPGTPADEQRFLDDLDRSSGRAIERVPISELRVLGNAAEAVVHLEMPDVVWDAFSEVYRRARRAGCAVILDGYFGDQALFPQRYLIDLARRGSWLTIRRDLRQFAAWMDADRGSFERAFWSTAGRALLPRRLFLVAKKTATVRRAARYPPWYTKAFVGRVLDRQMVRFESGRRFATQHAEECFLNATAGHYLLHFQRQSSAAAAMHGIALASPFRDRDLIAFLMGVPGDILSWQGVPKGLLRESLHRVLPPSIRNRRWKADFTLLLNRAALRDYDVVEQLLTRDSMTVKGGFVDPDVLRREVPKFRRRIEEDGDSSVAAWRLTELVAFECWLRHFFGPGNACTTS